MFIFNQQCYKLKVYLIIVSNKRATNLGHDMSLVNTKEEEIKLVASGYKISSSKRRNQLELMRLLTYSTKAHEISHVINLIRAIIGVSSALYCDRLTKRTQHMETDESCVLGITFAAIKLFFFFKVKISCIPIHI